MAEFNFLSMVVPVEEKDLEAFVNSLTNEDVKVYGQLFLENVLTIYNMLSLPAAFMSAAVMYAQFEMYLLNHLLDNGYSLQQARGLLNVPVDKRNRIVLEVMEQIQRDRFDERMKETRNKKYKAIEREFTKESNDIAQGLLAHYYSAISLTWTTFESIAADLWTSLVNKEPKKYGQKAFQVDSSEAAKQRGEIALKQPEGLSGKQIQFSLLAEYDFDLKDKMGTILKEKFDFTGVTGMVTAYAAIFPEKREDIKKVLDKPELNLLMKTRNLIAHKAGIVDSIFIRETKSWNPPPVTLGEPLGLDEKQTAKFILTGIMAGMELIKLVDAIA
ncbi:MAG: hypothetical protein J0I20_29345 [Chloroflexi bacterium]|nr:hypothetical protein [Chloroflexota bacterium]OJW05708.1 MAG: hypothetical protein BGO39_02550 [Chloroflexi bacterium 54-19]